MSIIFILLLITSSNLSFSSVSHLSCSKSGTHLVFVNGVGVDPGSFSRFRGASIDISKELNKGLVDEKSFVTYESYHNNSEGKLNDALETFLLYLETNKRELEISPESGYKLFLKALMKNPVGFDQLCKIQNAKAACDELNKIILFSENSSTVADIGALKNLSNDLLLNNKKIVFVSHSGGAVVVDRVRDYIKDHHPKKYNYTAHLAIARPFNTRHSNEYHLNFDQDGVINTVRDLGFGTPSSNVDLKKSCDPWYTYFLGIKNHYYNCYLGTNQVEGSSFFNLSGNVTSRQLVMDSIYRVSSYLENNDDDCCKKDPKVKRWINPYGEYGGVISKNVAVSGGQYLTINYGAQICGEGSIQVTSPSIIDDKSKLYGKINILGKFELRDFSSTESSNVELVNRSAYKSIFNIVQMDGDINMEGIINSGSSNFKGSLEMKCSAVLPSYCSAQISNSTIEVPKTQKSFADLTSISILRSNIYKKFSMSAYKLELEDSEVNGEILLANGSIVAKEMTLTKGLSFNGNLLELTNSQIDGELNINGVGNNFTLFNSNVVDGVVNSDTTSCPVYKDVSIFDYNLSGTNTFNSSVSIRNASPLTSYTISNFHSSDCVGVGSISAKSDIESFVGKGTFTLNVNQIGSGVTVDGSDGFVTIEGLTNNASNISSGSTMSGPLLWGCDVSGSIGPNEYCTPSPFSK